MRGSISANRYADALFQIGQEKNKLDEFQEELLVVKEVLEQDSQLSEFLSHSGISRVDKKQFIDQVFVSLNKDIVNMFKLLVEGHRTENMLTIIEEFTKFVNDLKGITMGEVHTVKTLPETELNELEEDFAKRLNKEKVSLEQIIDPSLIGGLKVVINNRVYDGTAANRLRRMEEHLQAMHK